MNPIAIILRELRRDTPSARAARRVAKQILALRVKPTAARWPKN